MSPASRLNPLSRAEEPGGAPSGLARHPVRVRRSAINRALIAAGAIALCLAGLAPAAPGRYLVVRDADDTAGRLDLTRVSFGRAPDGRLRAGFTMASTWDSDDLVAASGPPGSICLRLWATGPAGSTPPDYLVCVTARPEGRRLSASVMREREGGPPERVADAAVGRASRRSVVVRFAQTAVGRPAVLRFAAETTRAGCRRLSCIDTAPDAPATRRLVLRRGSSRSARD